MKPWDKEHPCNSCFIWNLRWTLVVVLDNLFSGILDLLDFVLKFWSILSQELDKSTSERLRLQEKNMALAKELATFKLWVHLHYMQINVSIFGCLSLSLSIYIYTVICLLLKWLYGSQSRVSDLDLDEGEVLKLASFGNGANNKDTVDILRKSLVMRNR